MTKHLLTKLASSQKLLAQILAINWYFSTSPRICNDGKERKVMSINGDSLLFPLSPSNFPHAKEVKNKNSDTFKFKKIKNFFIKVKTFLLKRRRVGAFFIREIYVYFSRSEHQQNFK